MPWSFVRRREGAPARVPPRPFGAAVVRSPASGVESAPGAQVDTDDNYYTLHMSNRRSIVKVEGHLCELPVVLGKGWQYVAVDLADVTRKAFGAEYYAAIQVRVAASCKLFRLYFAGREYSDIELPAHLRVLAMT